MPRIVCTVKADMYHLILGTKGRRSLGASMRDAVARAVEDEDDSGVEVWWTCLDDSDNTAALNVDVIATQNEDWTFDPQLVVDALTLVLQGTAILPPDAYPVYVRPQQGAIYKEVIKKV